MGTTSAGAVGLTVVFDNYAVREDCATAWGFACVVRGLERTILFDTGSDGAMLLDNMQRLELDPREVDVVVLSHDHWDHVDGLGDFLAANPEAEVVLPGPSPRARGQMPEGVVATEAVEPVELCPGAGTTGVVAGEPPEQALWVEAQDGIDLVTGCAHPGLLSLVKAARQASGRPVRALYGGFHTMEWSPERLGEAAEALRAAGVRRIGASHCSGDHARRTLADVFGAGWANLGVGRRLTSPRAGGG